MMIGRAAIGYPWIFNEIKHFFKTGEHLPQPTMKDRIEAARNHLTWSMDWKGERVGIVEMRRHYQLLLVVETSDPIGQLPGARQGRQEQRGQDRDDGDSGGPANW